MERKKLLISVGVGGCALVLVAVVTLTLLGTVGVGGGLAAFVWWDQQPKVFGEDYPHAVKVSEVRSVHHARQMQERLTEMQVETDILTLRDEDGAGRWYTVITGVSDEMAEVVTAQMELESQHELVGLDLLYFPEIQHRIIPLSQDELEEQNVIANPPRVGEPVVDVVERYPYSNALNVERLTVYFSPEDPELTWRHSVMHKTVSTDLPRGTNRVQVLRHTEAWSEAILTDNLYGDRVTLNVLKMKPDHDIEGKVVDYYSQAILDTGRYRTETWESFSVQADERLDGNKVIIETKAGHFRTYIILANPSQQWVYFSQTTDKTDDELKDVLAGIGLSNGMFEYSEFFNTFHTLPDSLQDGDSFLGFNMDRIRPAYAQEKGYAKWAKQCVGHWSASGFFYNEDKGPWSYGIFDLLNDDSSDDTYTLYGELTTGPEAQEVYGSDGWLVREQRWSDRTYRSYSWPNEVNFRQGRYVCMVNNAFQLGRLETEGLIARANSLQLQSAGGYAAR